MSKVVLSLTLASSVFLSFACGSDKDSKTGAVGEDGTCLANAYTTETKADGTKLVQRCKATGVGYDYHAEFTCGATSNVELLEKNTVATCVDTAGNLVEAIKDDDDTTCKDSELGKFRAAKLATGDGAMFCTKYVDNSLTYFHWRGKVSCETGMTVVIDNELGITYCKATDGKLWKPKDPTLYGLPCPDKAVGLFFAMYRKDLTVYLQACKVVPGIAFTNAWDEDYRCSKAKSTTEITISADRKTVTCPQ